MVIPMLQHFENIILAPTRCKCALSMESIEWTPIIKRQQYVNWQQIQQIFHNLGLV